MTVEKKVFVSPQDITAVKFACAKCHSAVILPIEKIPDGDIGILIARTCPHCRTVSGFNAGMKSLENLIAFNLLLAQLVESLQGGNLELSFEVDCPEEFA
jgi:hypothetical protein